MHSKTFQDISRHFETNVSVRTIRSSRRSTDSRFDRGRHLTPRLSHALPPTSTHLPGWSVRRFLRCLEFGDISRHFETSGSGDSGFDLPSSLICTYFSFTLPPSILSSWLHFYRRVCLKFDFRFDKIWRHFETFRDIRGSVR